MIAWRTTYMWYLLPLLMIGYISYVGWESGRLPVGFLSGQEIAPSPTVAPRVEAAMSIEPLIVNPVLRIDVPKKNIFAP